MKKLALVLIASLFVLLAGCLLPNFPYAFYVTDQTVITPAPVPTAAPAGDNWVYAPDYGWVYWDNSWVYLNDSWVYWPAFDFNVYQYYRVHPFLQYHHYYGGHQINRSYIPEQDSRGTSRRCGAWATAGSPRPDSRGA